MWGVVTVAINDGFSQGQDIPLIKDVQVRSYVNLDSVTGRYRYSYTIANPSVNTGGINSFSVDISKPTNGKEFSPEGYIIEKGLRFDGEKITRNFVDETGRLGSSLKKQVIPAGLNSPSNKWAGAITVYGEAHWGAKDNDVLIMPGQGSQEFELVSQGLPGIRLFEVKPFFILSLAGSIGPEDIKKADAIQKQITFHGTTVGPAAPPAQFVPLDFLTYLIDLKHQAEIQGWMGGPEFSLELYKKLDQVRERLAAGEIKPARGGLKLFIEKVEAQFKETQESEMEKVKEPENKVIENKNFITSEGFALLKFNAVYLRDQLSKIKEPEIEKRIENEPKKKTIPVDPNPEAGQKR